MRVACIGNMNHIFFSLVRFLRDRGVRADLLLSDDEHAHFHPSCDTFDEDYKSYTRRLSWGSATSYFSVSRRTVARDLVPYDIVVGCGFVPAFCHAIGRPLDFFVPYGADVEIYPFGVSKGHWLKRYPGRYIGKAQRRGIERAERVYFTDFFAPSRRALERLGVRFERRACTPIYFPLYERIQDSRLREQLTWASRFDEVRSRYRFLVFSPTRQYWKFSHRIGYGEGKGNDVLIRGFAHYVDGAGRRDVGLILFAYGRDEDVTASKRLCGELGVADIVHWFPTMARREVMYGASLCDVGADQFPGQEQSGAFGGTTVELMSLGKPVFGQLFYTAEEFRERSGFSMPPLLNVKSPQELATILGQLVDCPARVADLGRHSSQWVRDWYGWSVVDHYVSEIAATERKTA
jgi:glycosyltransferase involved in cell wall biosynthesis